MEEGRQEGRIEGESSFMAGVCKSQLFKQENVRWKVKRMNQWGNVISKFAIVLAIVICRLKDFIGNSKMVSE